MGNRLHLKRLITGNLFKRLCDGMFIFQSHSFACTILPYSRKTKHELSKIFVEHARTLLTQSFEPKPNSRALTTAGSVMTSE